MLKKIQTFRIVKKMIKMNKKERIKKFMVYNVLDTLEKVYCLWMFWNNHIWLYPEP